VNVELIEISISEDSCVKDVELLDDESKLNNNEKRSQNKILDLISKIRRSNTTLLIVIWIAIFVDCLFYSIVIPLLPLYLQQLKVSQAMIGVLYASFSVSTLLTTPFAPFLVDKLGKKNTMLGGMFILESSTLLFAYGTDFWVLLVARVLQGLASGISWCSGLSMIADAFPS
jgi:MFS family permease